MNEYEQKFFEVAHQVMTDRQPLAVSITIAECWLLISGLQLCNRHPELSPIMRRQLEQIGRQFQQAIVDTHPDATELIEMGWNAEFDI